MQKKLTAQDTEFQMFREYWRIYEKYNIPENSPEYWSDFLYELAELEKKYPTEFARDLILALSAETQRKFKEGYGHSV